MIGRQQRVQRDRLPLDLPPLGPLHPSLLRLRILIPTFGSIPAPVLAPPKFLAQGKPQKNHSLGATGLPSQNRRTCSVSVSPRQRALDETDVSRKMHWRMGTLARPLFDGMENRRTSVLVFRATNPQHECPQECSELCSSPRFIERPSPMRSCITREA